MKFELRRCKMKPAARDEKEFGGIVNVIASKPPGKMQCDQIQCGKK